MTNPQPQSKAARLRDMMRAGQWEDAIRLAASFGRLGRFLGCIHAWRPFC